MISNWVYRLVYSYFSSTFIILMFWGLDVSAQVAGVSANKLTLLSASILSEGTFEFEPAFSVINSHYIFNEKWEAQKREGLNTASSLDFRMTVGLTEQLEFGASISSSIEDINFGAKFLLLSNDDIGIAISGGTTLPAGNKFVADSSLAGEYAYTTSLGPVLSYCISETNSIDIAIFYTTALGNSSFNDQIYGGLGWGYSVKDNLQLVLEVAGFACFNKELCSGKLSLFPGITYDITNNFSFAFGFQHDLFGKNEDNGFGYFGAFTITFD
jgi:hypothetical protein